MDQSRLRDRIPPPFSPPFGPARLLFQGPPAKADSLQSLRARSTNHGFAAGRDSHPALDVNRNALETAFTHVGYQPPPGQFLFDRQTLRFAARDIPLVPEPGTAWWRDFHQHDLAEGKACKSPQGPGETKPDVVVLVRRVVVVAVRGGQVVVVVVPGAPAQPARRAGLFLCGMPHPFSATQHCRAQAPTVGMRHMADPRIHTRLDLRQGAVPLEAL